MPENAQLAWVDVKGGMNAADPPNKISNNQVARMVNCALVKGLPTTRPPVRVVPLSGVGSEFIRLNNFQGSIFHNPAKGQGGILLAESNPKIAIVSAGRKFVVQVDGRSEKAKGTVTDITGNLVSNPRLHLAWLSSWEDLLVIQDGQSPAFIWDSKNTAVESDGYNTTEKDKSQIPNGGTVMAYAHARGIVVVNSRFILAGDSLHRTDSSSSSNLREFVEQVYWATGQYFLPPSSMGNITAAAILPQRNTEHGHGDVMFHCEDGIFSINFNIFPREQWASTPMAKHALLQAGATGPYAIALQDGDQIFRSRKGLQTLRSAAATSLLEGSPEQPLSVEVATWLNADYPRWMRFASVNLWDKVRRLLVTTTPVVHGRYRWHRGLLVRNTDPAETSDNTKSVWEGLWTFAPQMAGIVQLVNGLFDQDQRQFAWVRGSDRQTRLIEFLPSGREDILEDGTRRPIRCQLMTRAIDSGKWWMDREFQTGRLYLRDVVGKVRWGVWFRPSEATAWIPWKAGSVVNPEMATEGLLESAPRTIAIPLGDLPHKVDCEIQKKPNESRSIQFLIRWEGYCQIEGLRIAHGEKELSDDLKPTAEMIELQPQTTVDYSDHEYSETEEPLWITSEKVEITP